MVCKNHSVEQFRDYEYTYICMHVRAHTLIDILELEAEIFTDQFFGQPLIHEVKTKFNKTWALYNTVVSRVNAHGRSHLSRYFRASQEIEKSCL